MGLVYLFYGKKIMNLKNLSALALILIFNYSTYGQDENYYVSDNNDTIKFAKNMAFFRIGTFVGKGLFVYHRNRIKINTIPFERQRGQFEVRKNDRCKYPVVFVVHNFCGEPIRNAQIILLYNHKESLFFQTDSNGYAYIESIKHASDIEIIINLFGYYPIKVPLKDINCTVYYVSLERTALLYSENEKVVLKTKKENNGFILESIKVNGLYDKKFKPIHFRKIRIDSLHGERPYL